MSKVFYLAGPMTGIPQFNFPAFRAAAAALRERGFEVISPAELDSPAVQAAAIVSKDGKLDAHGKIAGETWGDILSKDVKVVADKVRGIIFLPGWEKSRGARLEAYVALLCKHEFHFYLGDGRIESLRPTDVLAEIVAYTDDTYGAQAA